MAPAATWLSGYNILPGMSERGPRGSTQLVWFRHLLTVFHVPCLPPAFAVVLGELGQRCRAEQKAVRCGPGDCTLAMQA